MTPDEIREYIDDAAKTEAESKARLLKKWGRGEHLSDEEADFLDRHIPFMYGHQGPDADAVAAASNKEDSQ